MNFTNSLRKGLIKLTGYWIYRKKYLPVGTDLMEDLKTKINLDIRTIFDVGANIGNTTYEYNDAFPKAHIFSFEPISTTFLLLETKLKGLINVCCHKIAFGENKGFVEVKLFDENEHYLNSLELNSMNSKKSAKIELVEVDTIDHFLNNHAEISTIDLLKIDTEGFEIQVLKGASSAIQNGRIKLIYLEVGFSKSNHRSTYISDIHDFFDANNFSFFGLYDMSIQRISDKYQYANVLFIHDSVKTNYLLE